MPIASPAIIEDVAERHFKEACLLWSQREIAAHSTNYALSDLTELDEQIDSHINGLRLAGDRGWLLCASKMDHEQSGSVFTAAVIAFESADPDKIDLIANTSGKSQLAFRAVISALGWLDDKHFRLTIVGLVSAQSWQYRSLGIAACGERRVNPKAYLNQTIDSTNLFLKVVSLKAAGELKREDVLPVLIENLQHEDPACRFEAIRSALLLGERSVLDLLSNYVLSQSKFTLPAAQIAFRLVDGRTAMKWLKAIYSIPEQRHLMLTAAGITGNPAYIPLLIKQMHIPELARAAGDAFSMITGADLNKAKLSGQPPAGFEASANLDAGAENSEMDPDKDLSWPDAVLVTDWWEQNSGEFPPGTRFLAGSEISTAHCMLVLNAGCQRDRQAAALELALSQSDADYFNTNAPGHWQLKRI